MHYFKVAACAHLCHQGVSPALKRARDPLRARNAVTGTLLTAFALSVWAYSISAVKQDTLGDIDTFAADKQVQVTVPLNRSVAIADSLIPFSQPTVLHSVTAQRASDVYAFPISGPTAPANPLITSFLLFRPSILDRLTTVRHSDGTLIVWGAPAIEKVGSIGDRDFAPWEETC